MARGMHKGPKPTKHVPELRSPNSSTLERRIRGYEETVSGKQGYKKPGSNKK